MVGGEAHNARHLVIDGVRSMLSCGAPPATQAELDEQTGVRMPLVSGPIVHDLRAAGCEKCTAATPPALIY